jgi:uncharacterized protein
LLLKTVYHCQSKYESIMVWPKATIVNMLTVSVGSIIGILLKNVFSDDIQDIVFQAVGLGTLLIGIKMALRLPDGYLLVFFFSLIIGAIIGQMLRIDLLFNDLSEFLKTSIGNQDSGFSEGLISAFLLFCVGSMTIVGALEEGLQQKRELLYAKSLLDGFSSIALASTYGVGVMFSIIPMFIFQGGITLMASRLQHVASQPVMDSLSATGGMLIIGISIHLLELGKINLENLLPALIIVAILAYYYSQHLMKSKGLEK